MSKFRYRPEEWRQPNGYPERDRRLCASAARRFARGECDAVLFDALGTDDEHNLRAWMKLFAPGCPVYFGPFPAGRHGIPSTPEQLGYCRPEPLSPEQPLDEKGETRVK